jgi:hypothetical protein
VPDVWTKHPDIVRDLLREAGFTCGATPRFLQGRDPAWTCIYDGKTLKGDLYIHNVAALRTEAPTVAPVSLAEAGAFALPAVALLLVAALQRWRRGRKAHR